jgi:hypothetical protein
LRGEELVNSLLRVIILLLGVAFTITVFYLLMKKKITERNSFLWLLGSLFVLFFSINPLTIDKIAHYVGVEYPPTLLFLFAILLLLFINLYHSIQISILTSQVRELAQIAALQETQNKYPSVPPHR